MLVLHTLRVTKVISWSLWEPSYHQPSTQTLKQKSALMETQTALMLFLALEVSSATQKRNLHPGLPSTTALRSPSKGLRSSTDVNAAGIELEILTSAFRMSFQLLAFTCFLEVTSLATFLDLPPRGNC